MEDRLQKILSRAGVGSRRACDTLITQGRVTVNGKIAVPGQKADPERDDIRVDGQRIRTRPVKKVYIALYKPRGVLSSTRETDTRPTVRDLVPVEGHLYPVGRLDYESEGLILLTNDGDLTNKLTHPRYQHEKEYRVLVAREPAAEQLEALRHGIVLEDGRRTAPAKVRLDESVPGKGTWLTMVLTEGRKRQIREMCLRVGLPVKRLIRVRIGNLRLGKMRPKEWRHLTRGEVSALKRYAASPPPAWKRNRRSK
ncbi:MAG TPA: rRNA pseudouridine synthase [Chloroflexi bacterium]|nr:rRNA pseudouridine synthase [Chloroflexota bacterium]